MENLIKSNSGFSYASERCLGNGKDDNNLTNENKILINKGDSSHESTLIDIESNCCNFNNNQRNTRRKIINISIILMNLITLAGIITLLIKK